jgi:hypothetical protein
MNTSFVRWQWVKDRLEAVPAWRLWWALVIPIGFGLFWLVVGLRTGQVAWAVVFGILLAISLAGVVASVVLKVRRRPSVRE